MAIKIRLVVLLLAIAGLVSAGYFVIAAPVQARGHVVHSTMLLFDAGPVGAPPAIRYNPLIEVVGTQSELTRKGDEIWAKINTKRLPPGAYTNWWIVFNNPAGCAVEAPATCGSEDFPVPAAEASVLWATGGVVGDDGKARFEAHLKVGIAPGQVLFGLGLTDAMNAEIHYVIRFHGPTNTQTNITETVELMTTTVEGGCNNAGAMAGNFACWDPQATVFPLAN